MLQITGFILAAGLGTRLRPLTNDRPKALVELMGRPLLAHAIDRMAAAGIRQIVVNAHHFAPKIAQFLQSYQAQTPAQLLLSDESDLLRDTGGAISHALPIFHKIPNHALLIYNADIYSDIDIALLYDQHLKNKAFATLATRSRPSSRSLLFAPDGQLVGWQNTATNQLKQAQPCPNSQALSFSGIHLLDYAALAHLPHHAPVFSVIDWYLEQAAAHQKIYAYTHDQDYWFDVGKPAQLAEAQLFAQNL